MLRRAMTTRRKRKRKHSPRRDQRDSCSRRNHNATLSGRWRRKKKNNLSQQLTRRTTTNVVCANVRIFIFALNESKQSKFMVPYQLARLENRATGKTNGLSCPLSVTGLMGSLSGMMRTFETWAKGRSSMSRSNGRLLGSSISTVAM